MATEQNIAHWFDISVADLARAQAFYETVLGVTMEPKEQGPVKMAWFRQHKGAPNCAGGLVQAPGKAPCRDGTLIYLHVGDVDATLAKVVAAGGKIAMPSASGDYGTVAHFEDSEGNVVGLYGDPKPAK